MKKLWIRYLIYFGVFIGFIQLLEYPANRWLCLDVEAIGAYAPLFLSALLIDITYRIGKRQNEIAEQQKDVATRQNEIAEQQRKIQEAQHKLDKFNSFREMHRHLCDLRRIAQIILNNVTHFIASQCQPEHKEYLIELKQEVEKIRANICNDEADYLLRYGKERDMADAEGFSHLLVHLITEIELFERKDLKGTKYIEKYGFGEAVTVINKSIEEQIELIKTLANDKELGMFLDEFLVEFNMLFVDENCVLKQIQREYAE